MFLKCRNISSQQLKNNFFNINSSENNNNSILTNQNNNIPNKIYNINHQYSGFINSKKYMNNKVGGYKNLKERFIKNNNISIPLNCNDDRTCRSNMDSLPDISNNYKYNSRRYEHESLSEPHCYEKIIQPKYKRIYIKRNTNKNNALNEYLKDKNLSKSQSDVNITRNNNNYNNNINPLDYNSSKENIYAGKEITDITNYELFDKYKIGENSDYIDYKDKYREISLYNKQLMENKNKQKKADFNYSVLSERNRIKEENDYYNKLIMKKKQNAKEKQRKYKFYLDEQIKNVINNKLSNENLSYREFIKNNAYERQKMRTPVQVFLNKNDYVDVNPFNNREISLGQSNLEYNTILNPRIQFKVNKYIFPKIVNSNQWK